MGNRVIDVRTLGAKTGFFTHDPGFTSTSSCLSAITYIDGDKGVLLHRGYAIADLAAKCSFPEVRGLT
jgi:citrate synthase